MIQWGASASFEDEFDWGTEMGRRNVCGLIACIFGVLIAFTSTTWFRSTYYYVSRGHPELGLRNEERSGVRRAGLDGRVWRVCRLSRAPCRCSTACTCLAPACSSSLG